MDRAADACQSRPSGRCGRRSKGGRPPPGGSLDTPLLALPAVFLAAALAGLVLSGWPRLARAVTYSLCAVGGFATAAFAVPMPTGAATLFQPTPFLTLGLRVDPLSAAFALPLGLAVGAVSVAALGYARHYDAHGGPRLAALYALFAATMLLVLLADGVFSFLLIWEAMSLVGYGLVVQEHHRAEVRRAGFVYLAMAHLGTAFIVAGLLVLVGAAPGSPLGFASLAAAGPGLSPLTRDLAFVACLIGFSAKAGAVPLHVWLPRAHPVAPSHVSALMSGVMIKTALYGLARVAFDLLGPPGIAPAWWGWLVLAVGLTSGVFGALFAVIERDLKRLLAYSSVENVGIVLIGFGVALAVGPGQVAALALTAALLHTLNHALFKSLLFVGAGAVDQAAGTRDLERLGGLLRAMPRLGALFLFGVVAIAALPPLNGFAGEWLTFQALVELGSAPGWGALGALAAAALLALTAGMAAAAFAKAFGLAFLGLPRDPSHVARADAPAAVQVGLALLALPCLAIGLMPGAAAAMLSPAARLVGSPGLAATDVSGARGTQLLGAPLFDGLKQAAIQPALLLGILLVLGAVLWLALRWLGPVPYRRGPVWVCGFDLAPAMQYGAAGYGETLRLFFRKVLRPSRVARPAAWVLAPLFPARLVAVGTMPPLFEHHLYTPTTHALLRFANLLREIQNGSLRRYLLYVFATLVVLLVVTR